MSDFTEKRVSRRTIAKGAAWSVPVVAVAAAAPAHAASPTGDDVTVSATCKNVFGLDFNSISSRGGLIGAAIDALLSTVEGLLNTLGLSVSIDDLGLIAPSFSVTVVGTTLGAGSTFDLSGGGLAGVKVLGPDANLLNINALGGGQGANLTTTSDIAPGSKSFYLGGLASVDAAQDYTLTLGQAIGNANDDASNDTDTQNVNGVSLDVDGAYDTLLGALNTLLTTLQALSLLPGLNDAIDNTKALIDNLKAGKTQGLLLGACG